MKVILLGFFAIFVVAFSYGNQHYCGRVLSDALEYMCRTRKILKQSDLLGYEGDGNVKRSSFQDGQEDFSNNVVGDKETVLKRSSYALEIQDYGWPMPWLEHHKALALNSARTKRQGIANECCVKACSVDEMLDYCQY